MPEMGILEESQPYYMRRIDRYLLAEMTIPAVVGVMILLLLLIGNVLYSVLLFLYGGASPHIIGQILLYRLPEVLLQAIPGALLLGTALALNRLERDRELLALRMAGMRLKRTIVPYIILGLLAAVGIFALQETVIPRTTHQAELLTRQLTWGTPTAVVQQDVFFKTDNYVFYVGEVDTKQQVLRQVLVYKKDANTITLLVIPWAENHNGRWFFKADPATKEPPLIYKFGSNGTRTLDITQYGTLDGAQNYIDMKGDVWNYISDQPSRPEELTFVQLLSFLKSVRGAGIGISGNTLSLTPKSLVFFLHRKLAISLAPLVAILIAIPLSIHFGRSGGYVGLLLSVVVAFFFIISQQWAQVLAVKEMLDPILAAWAPDAIFGFIGIVLLFFEE